MCSINVTVWCAPWLHVHLISHIIWCPPTVAYIWQSVNTASTSMTKQPQILSVEVTILSTLVWMQIRFAYLNVLWRGVQHQIVVLHETKQRRCDESCGVTLEKLWKSEYRCEPTLWVSFTSYNSFRVSSSFLLWTALFVGVVLAML